MLKERYRTRRKTTGGRQNREFDAKDDAHANCLVPKISERRPSGTTVFPYLVVLQSSDSACIVRRRDSKLSLVTSHVDNSLPIKDPRKCVRFSDAEQEHLPPKVDTGQSKCLSADIDLHLYVSMPQNDRIKKAHEHKRITKVEVRLPSHLRLP